MRYDYSNDEVAQICRSAHDFIRDQVRTNDVTPDQLLSMLKSLRRYMPEFKKDNRLDDLKETCREEAELCGHKLSCFTLHPADVRVTASCHNCRANIESAHNFKTGETITKGTCLTTRCPVEV